jgi:transcriptional regulator with XRE-family HTH domain
MKPRGPQKSGSTTASAPNALRPIGKQVGERIAGLRQQRGLTLEDLDRGTGLTRSYLSKLERGQTSISVDNLRTISHFLGVEMVYFFERDGRSSAIVTRKGEGAPLAIGGMQATGESLITTRRSTLQSTLYHTPPGQGRDTGFSHVGEEFVFVLKGCIRYFVGENDFLLKAGDSIWHFSSEPHRWVNPTQAGAVSLHVNTPPVW